GTTTLAAAVATVATLGTGLATVTTTAVATATTVSATTATLTTATATVAAVATILTTRGRRLGIGKRGTGKGVDELEAHLAPVDLTDPHLEKVALGEIILDPLDPLGAVETGDVEQAV